MISTTSISPPIKILALTLAAMVILIVGCSSPLRSQSSPLALHSENPHYFIFRGRPTVLITSAEHYGAVLNLDFDYGRYLKTLSDDGMNLTRIFSGAYVEPGGAFNIAENTLAPGAGRYLSPGARSEKSGYAKGGNKFDLTRWDENYFKRLKDFVGQASRRGIVVEMNLFCPFYEESQWKLSPQNAGNNINHIGSVARTNVYTLDRNGGLLAVHDALVRKIVGELKTYDNVYYEICNEPYFGGVTMEWQQHIADVIVDAESNFPRQHLISQNIANRTATIWKPHPAVSIFNFHYASPPDAVKANYALNKVIGDNETGFRGTNDAPYRMEAWEFLLAGGGLFNNLDYSFVAGHEDGSFVYPAKQPGGGNADFRKQMGFLSRFINSFNFLKMHPDDSLLKNPIPAGVQVRVLSDPGRQYALYMKKERGGGPGSISLALPGGEYLLEWWNPVTLEKRAPTKRSVSPGKPTELAWPDGWDETAVRLLKKE